jgi:ABC-type dipeptide/oligopeptide/nickel transport system permease subunit
MSSIVIVSAVFNVAGAIIAEAGLSYLGVGIGPPLQSRGNIRKPGHKGRLASACQSHCVAFGNVPLHNRCSDNP